MITKAHKTAASLMKCSSDYGTKLFWRYADEAVKHILCIFLHFHAKKMLDFQKKKNRPLADSHLHARIKTNF